MTDKETNLTPEVMKDVEKQIGGAVRRLGNEDENPVVVVPISTVTGIYDAGFAAGEKAGAERMAKSIREITLQQEFLKEHYPDRALKADTSDLAEDKK